MTGNHLFACFILIYTLTIAAPAIAHRSDSTRIDIFIKNKDSGKIILRTPVGEKTLDLEMGKASISLKLDRVCEILLFTDPNVKDLDDSSIVRFIMQPSDVTVSLSLRKGVAESIHIVGSNAQKDLEEWKTTNYDLLKSKEAVRKERNQLKLNRNSSDNYPGKKEDSLNSRLQEIYQKLGERSLQLVETNPESYAGAYLLLWYRTIIHQDSLEKYYLKLSPSVQQAQFSINLFDQLYTLSSKFRARYDNIHTELKDAQTVFDFTIPDVNDQSIKLSAFRGKPVMLFFWATWCGPCHERVPQLEALINKYKNDSVTFISVSIDKNPEEFKKSDKRIALPCITLLDSKNVLRYFYKFLYVPTFILLDHKGQIVRNDTSTYALNYDLSMVIERYRKDVQSSVK